MSATDYLNVLKDAFGAMGPLVLALLSWALVLSFADWAFSALHKAGSE